MPTKFTCSILGFLLALLSPVTAKEKMPTAEQLRFFEKSIRPVLAKNCTRCHGLEKQRGNLRLDSREAMLQGGDSGPAIVVGKPEKSLLIKAIRHVDEDLQMPPKGKLKNEEIDNLTQWIKQGSPWPGADLSLRAKAKITDKDKQYWAFRPLQVNAPPSGQGTVIDRFLQAQYEAQRLQPVDLANRTTLLRRATYDLIGLPPMPKDIRDFLNDTSPNAFAKVIDRLLASPHYGERWGRHWLDLVRYADTSGCNSDFPIREAYRYRNYVIDAFNNDLPYDEFLKEQLAGDLMASTNQEEHNRRLIATGYLAQARRFGSVVLGYPQHLTIEDTIDNLGKVMLGLTISCARCHDHKFDPILNTDYYALYGIFENTEYSFPGLELAPVPRKMLPLMADKEFTKHTSAFEKKRQPMLNKIDSARQAYDKAWAKYQANLDSHVLEREAWHKHQAFTRALKAEGKLILKEEPDYPRAYGAVDAKTFKDAHRQIKGDPENLGEVVARRFLTVLGGQSLSEQQSTKTSGRLQLAQWIIDSPLSARVMVNRIWQHHFGRGLVATSNNFGRQGQKPSHPQLLDYLAQRLIDNKWSIKAMHREIMLSRAYQLDSRGGDENQQRDPNNVYVWRQNRQRLDAESLRDTLLYVSGQLQLGKLDKPHPFPAVNKWSYSQHHPFGDFYEHNYRSVYLLNKRLRRPAYFTTFDGADANASVESRPQSVTTPQALYLLNHEQIQAVSEKVAAQLKDEQKAIEQVWLRLLGRLPTSEEQEQAKEYLQRVKKSLKDTENTKGLSKIQIRASLVRVLLRTNEFMYVD